MTIEKAFSRLDIPEALSGDVIEAATERTPSLRRAFQQLQKGLLDDNDSNMRGISIALETAYNELFCVPVVEVIERTGYSAPVLSRMRLGVDAFSVLNIGYRYVGRLVLYTEAEVKRLEQLRQQQLERTK